MLGLVLGPVLVATAAGVLACVHGETGKSAHNGSITLVSLAVGA